MTAERWTHAVRSQLALGRLLPLGDYRSGAWIAESAARAVLLDAAKGTPGVRVTALRIGPAPGARTREAAVPPPPSALAPGALLLTAELEATAAQPLPTSTARLRTALSAAAHQRLGLDLTGVDLRVTGLRESEPETSRSSDGPSGDPRSWDPRAKDSQARDPQAPVSRSQDPRSQDRSRPSDPHLSDSHPSDAAPSDSRPSDADLARLARAASAVPGVARLTGTLGRRAVPGGLGHSVQVTEARRERATAAAPTALPRRHVRVELAVAAGRRALDVAEAVRREVAAVLPDEPTVAVVVTAVEG